MYYVFWQTIINIYWIIPRYLDLLRNMVFRKRSELAIDKWRIDSNARSWPCSFISDLIFPGIYLHKLTCAHTYSMLCCYVTANPRENILSLSPTLWYSMEEPYPNDDFIKLRLQFFVFEIRSKMWKQKRRSFDLQRILTITVLCYIQYQRIK